MRKETVILVDANDNALGEMEKLEAHQKGQLHRAFSIFIFNSKGELLLQKRALDKYHSGGLWTNTCCSHPRVGENIPVAALRRLEEEMGFTCNLQEVFSFIYCAALNNELTEYEFDHVLFGSFEEKPKVNPLEVAEWKWMSMADTREQVKVNPGQFTAWFLFMFDQVSDHAKNFFPKA